jgi:hypothetical protein
MRQVGEVLLEGSRACDHLPFHLECRHAVGDALVGVRDDPQDGFAQQLQGRLLRLFDLEQVLVDLGGGQCRVLLCR